VRRARFGQGRQREADVAEAERWWRRAAVAGNELAALNHARVREDAPAEPE